MRGRTKTGVCLWERAEPTWYYWLDGKQGYPTGNIPAPFKRAAKKAIATAHPDSQIDAIMSYDEHHCL